MNLESAVTLAVFAFGAYALLGFVYACYFVSVGVGAIDPVAREGSKGFRLLILPGVCALWPLLLLRQVRGQQKPPIENNAHRQRTEGERA